MKGVESCYLNSIACVSVGNSMSDWFPVKVGLCQGCVMLPRLLDIYVYEWCFKGVKCKIVR